MVLICVSLGSFYQIEPHTRIKYSHETLEGGAGDKPDRKETSLDKIKEEVLRWKTEARDRHVIGHDGRCGHQCHMDRGLTSR